MVDLDLHLQGHWAFSSGESVNTITVQGFNLDAPNIYQICM